MAKLIMVMGPQASGKTTKVNEIHAILGYEIVSSDLYWPRDDTTNKRYWINHETQTRHDWGTEPITAEELAKAHRWAYGHFLKNIMQKQNIIYESTFIRNRDRKKIIMESKEEGYTIEGIFIHPSLLRCAERNESREDRVPDIILARTYSKIQLPDKSEGFEKLEIIYVP